MYLNGYDIPAMQTLESRGHAFGYADSDSFAEYDLQECGVFRVRSREAHAERLIDVTLLCSGVEPRYSHGLPRGPTVVSHVAVDRRNWGSRLQRLG